MTTQLEALHRQGILRVGTPSRGFRYRKAGGGAAPRQEVARIEALRIPPAWKEVAVAPSAAAKLQAVGKDQAGRWQYRYSEGAVRERDARKYQRLLLFADALPRMRLAIDRDLRRRDLSRDHVMGCILRILSTCFLRPGSAVYARENGSFGIATLLSRHVKVQGDVVRFDFPGKSHQRQVRELRDRRVARTVRALLALPGRELFKWVEPDGAVANVRRRHINAYIKETMGRRFSAKDFRTWAGTLICACALARSQGSPDFVPGRTDRKKLVAAAIREAAGHLGNTPAVCRASYVFPSVIASFNRGRVVRSSFGSLEELIDGKPARARAVEHALLQLLREGAAVADGTRPSRRAPAKARFSGRQHRLARAFAVQ
ncbi:MAG: DNA topoisomerase IB [Myxococcales bacterium]